MKSYMGNKLRAVGGYFPIKNSQISWWMGILPTPQDI
jgi:hypothetical protein